MVGRWSDACRSSSATGRPRSVAGSRHGHCPRRYEADLNPAGNADERPREHAPVPTASSRSVHVRPRDRSCATPTLVDRRSRNVHHPGDDRCNRPNAAEAVRRSACTGGGARPSSTQRPTTSRSSRTSRAVLRVPHREYTVNFPVKRDDGSVERVPGLPRPAQRGPRSGQGRPAIPPGDGPRRRPRAGDVDDLEMRSGGRPVRRGEGRRHLRSLDDEPEGARGADPAVRDRARRHHRAGLGHPGARRRAPTPRRWPGSWTPSRCTAAIPYPASSQASRSRSAARSVGPMRPARASSTRSPTPHAGWGSSSPVRASRSRASATSARRRPGCSMKRVRTSSRSPMSTAAS